jgi:hypothetical protein
MCNKKSSPLARAACPYCAELIPTSALICSACRKDVAVFMPIISEAQNLREMISELKKDIDDLRSPRSSVDIVSAPREVLVLPGVPLTPHATRPAIMLLALFMGALCTVVGAHWAIVIKFDLWYGYLRISSIIIPFIFGILSYRITTYKLKTAVCISILLSIASILLMSISVSYADGKPIFPDNARDLYEAFEYAASVALAFLGGTLALKLLKDMKDFRLNTTRYIESAHTESQSTVDSVVKRISQANQVYEAIGTAGTILMSLIAGLRIVFT